MAEATLRLPVGGFEQISRILRAYLAATRSKALVPVKLDDVAHRAAMNRTIVSANSAFLVSLGLIEGGNNKQLTDRGLQAALTLDHPDTPAAFDAWTSVVEASPELERVVDAVRIRKGMDEDSLLSHIVLTAGVPKTARSLTGARTIVDILEFAGVVEESDGTFTVRTDFYDEVTSEGTGEHPVSEGVRRFEGERPAGTKQPAGDTPANVTLNVHVWVNASDADFQQLAEELKELLSRLSGT